MTISTRMLAGWAVAIVVLLAGAWMLGGGPSAATAQADPVGIWQQHIDARNAGDLDGAIALMTEDAVFEGSIGCQSGTGCVGKEAIRAEFENFLADNTQIAIVSAELTDNTVTDQWQSTSDCGRVAGVARFSGSDTVQFTNEKISSVVVMIDLTAVTNEQTESFVACVLALGEPAGVPETGTGGFLADGGSAIPSWWYLLPAVGVLLVLGGLAVQMGKVRRE